MQAKYRHLIIVTLVAMLSSFVSAAAGQSAPEMTSPTPGSTFDGPSATFSWSANDTAVNRWWLYVGTSRGSRDILERLIRGLGRGVGRGAARGGFS